jgi:hypothetical protein
VITRRFQKGDAASVAVYSDCERYRYSLTRVWDDAGRRALFIMLNPSTATEVQNDPTVERCERRARALGFGAFRVLNIFAWRATDPRDMRAAVDPVGPGNDAAILESLPWADSVICAWGTHGAHLGRGPQVEALLRRGGGVDASGPVEGRPPEAPALHRLRGAARGLAGARLTATARRVSVAHGTQGRPCRSRASTQQFVETNGTRLSVHRAGAGTPLILLHGYPQNHMAWEKVAPGFAGISM